MSDYDNAELYDCRDPENLRHETVEDAIEEMVELWLDPGSDVAAVIAERGEITVTAYNRRSVPDSEITALAERVVEDFAECIGDEYGNPDGDPFDEFAAGVLDTLTGKVAVLLREAANGARIWSCEEVGSRTYSAAKVEEMMRKWRPDWFEDAAIDALIAKETP
jgi:hypothetical protein